MVSKFTTCVISIEVVAVVRVVMSSVIGNVSPIDVLGLGVVWVVGDSVSGVDVVVLDWVKGLVFGVVDSAFDVVTIDAGGVFEEMVSSSSKVEVDLVLPSLGAVLLGWLEETAVVD